MKSTYHLGEKHLSPRWKTKNVGCKSLLHPISGNRKTHGIAYQSVVKVYFLSDEVGEK